MRTREKRRAAGAGLALTLWVTLVSGCGEVAGLPTAELSSVGPEPPPAGTAYPLLMPTPTEDPYPWPTQPPLPTFTPSPSPGPPPIMLGAEWAPPGARETYVSVTVVVASVGDGAGEIGYWQAPEAGRIWANRFTVDAAGNIYVLDKVNHRVVKFDREGRFAGEITYPDTLRARLLAADAAGRVYLYVPGDIPERAGVRCYEAGGRLVREYLRPSWLHSVTTIQVDAQGLLWVTGDGYYPSAPLIEDTPYSGVTVPLGTVEGVLDPARQQDMAVPGRLLEVGGPVLTYSGHYRYLYDREGRPSYQLDKEEFLTAIDRWGNLYTFLYSFKQGKAPPEISHLTKYDSQGRTLASFDLPTARSTHKFFTGVWVTPDATIYILLLDWETPDAYRVIRWQRQ